MVRDTPKPQRTGRIAAALIALALVSGMPAGAAWATPLLTGAPNPVDPGNTVVFTLTDTVDAADLIDSIDLQVTFDPAVLAFNSVANSAVLNALGWATPTANVSPPGIALISISECDFSIPSCGSPLSGTDFALLTLSFDVLADAATGPASVTAETPSDLTDPTVYPTEYQLPPVTGTVSVAAAQSVPAPGLSLFLLPGLVFAGFLTRTRRRRAAPDAP